METVLYIVWFALPSTLFLMALWSKLEQLSGKNRRNNASDLLKQGLFLLLCSFLCIAIDKALLAQVADALAPELLPLGFYQVILLPLVLFVAAKVVGGSKSILIGSGQAVNRSNQRPPRRRS